MCETERIIQSSVRHPHRLCSDAHNWLRFVHDPATLCGDGGATKSTSYPSLHAIPRFIPHRPKIDACMYVYLPLPHSALTHMCDT
jgi:hypothetical protein